MREGIESQQITPTKKDTMTQDLDIDDPDNVLGEKNHDNKSGKYWKTNLQLLQNISKGVEC
jgi:hypothetical protein